MNSIFYFKILHFAYFVFIAFIRLVCNNKSIWFSLKYVSYAVSENDNRNYCQICQGGKIPKELYTKNMDKSNENYTTVVVRKGGKLEFDISAPEVGSILR